MTLSFDFETFLKKGNFHNFNAATTEEDVANAFGNPDEIEDYDQKGRYFHYGSFRFLFSQKKLRGIDLLFFNSDFNLSLFVEEDTFIIDKNIELPAFLLLLNKYKLRWNIPYDRSLQDYLLLETSSGICIYYYFYNSKIERISCSLS